MLFHANMEARNGHELPVSRGGSERGLLSTKRGDGSNSDLFRDKKKPKKRDEI